MSKRVLFLALWFLPQVGGMEMSSYEIVKALRSNDIDVCVVTANHIEATSFDSEQDFMIYRVKGAFLGSLAEKCKMKRLCNYVSCYHKIYIEVKKAVTEFKPDEIIIADEQTRNWYGFYAGRIHYDPIVIVSMPEKKDEWIKVCLVRRTLRKAKKIYCVSNSTKRKMCETFGTSFLPKMDIMYRSISTDYLSRQPDDEEIRKLREKYLLDGHFVILSVCRLNEKKGIAQLLGAIRVMGEHGKNISILIAGSGPDEDRLRALTKEYGLSEQVIFCGQIHKEKIVDFYDLCNIFVLPSREESFGRVFMEAGARHRASVGCCIGGVTEVIDDGENGLLVPPNDEKALSIAVTSLMDDAEMCRKLAENMHYKVSQLFTFETMVENWKKILC